MTKLLQCDWLIRYMLLTQ